jgi:hypothetical protein
LLSAVEDGLLEPLGKGCVRAKQEIRFIVKHFAVCRPQIAWESHQAILAIGELLRLLVSSL